jgi:AcrR family transcriptional regulator
VAVEPVAVALGATKGSAYWHFSNRADFLAAVLDRWTQVGTLDIIDRVEGAGGTPQEKLAHLLGIVSRGAERSPTEMLLVASSDPLVRDAVRHVTELRVAYVEQLVRASGVPPKEARTRAALAYAAYLGHATLTSAVPGLVPDRPADRRRIQRALLGLALGATP